MLCKRGFPLSPERVRNAVQLIISEGVDFAEAAHEMAEGYGVSYETVVALYDEAEGNR